MACRRCVAVNRKFRTCCCSLTIQVCVLSMTELRIRSCVQWLGVLFFCDSIHTVLFFQLVLTYLVCVFSFDSVSRCGMNQSAAWTPSHPTPRLPNLCPSPAYSVQMNLCLQAESDSQISMLNFFFFLHFHSPCYSGYYVGTFNPFFLEQRVYTPDCVFL